MARRFDHLNEAIAEAKRLSDVLCARMIVRLSYGKFSVVDSRSHGSKAPIVWKPESKVKPMTVPNTPQMARMAETMTYEQMSEKTGYTFSQLVAAVRKYGWDKKPRDVVEIDIDWLEVQLKTRTPAQVADIVGVDKSRIYTLIRRHDIKAPVRNQRGRQYKRVIT